MGVSFSPAQPPHFLKLLAHEIRWDLLVLLTRSDYRVQELVNLVKQPQNLVSYHLRRLRTEGLVTEHRSTADSRDIYYSLDFATLQAHYTAATAALHPALNSTITLVETIQKLPKQPLRVLFLCTENSARSQMAEALLRDISKGRIEAYSAGSDPTRIHPYAIQTMDAAGISINQQRPKHFDEFRGQTFDCIITLCDRVIEACPTFPGDPEHVHWSFSNPATIKGAEAEKYAAFEQTRLQLATRIRLLLTLLEKEKRNY